MKLNKKSQSIQNVIIAVAVIIILCVCSYWIWNNTTILPLHTNIVEIPYNSEALVVPCYLAPERVFVNAEVIDNCLSACNSKFSNKYLITTTSYKCSNNNTVICFC